MNADTEFEQGRQNARNFGGTVYVGGVLAATMLFITFVLTAFPQNAYFSRIVMTIAGLAVGTSMLAFPVALHNWTVEKKHRQIATWLYYIEMIFIAVNTIVSFVNLLAKVTHYAAPEWAVLYEPFSVVSIIYVIFAWGTIFLTDPQSKTKQMQREYKETFDTQVAQTMVDYLKSPEGRRDIALAAQDKIRTQAQENQPRSFFEQPTTYQFQMPVVQDKPIPAPIPFQPRSQGSAVPSSNANVPVVAEKPSTQPSPINSQKTTRTASGSLEIRSCSYCGRQQEAPVSYFRESAWAWKYIDSQGTLTICDACNIEGSPQREAYLSA